MKKLNEFFFVLISICTLFFVACRSELSNVTSDPESGKFAYIRVSIDDAVSEMVTRSVLPSFESDYTGFKKFDFTGTKEGESSPNISLSWTTDETNSAYSKATSATIPLPLVSSDEENYTENWTFVLTGYFGGTTTEDATVYSDTVVKDNITVGSSNSVAFSLKRTSAFDYTVPLEGERKGNISFVLNFTDANPSSVVKVKASLSKVDGTGSPTVETFNVSSNAATIAFDNVDVGAYVLAMEFYSDQACTIKVGTLKEYPYVLWGLTSKLYGTSNQINVNATYTITYKKGTETFTGFASGYTAPGEFSRITGVDALPVSENLADSVTAAETFLGWYQNADFSDQNGPLTSIATNTIVQNLTLYGKFISKNEVPTVQGVTFKYDSADSPSESTFKVGHTLTATPYFTNNSTNSPFLGTISSWKWYYGEGESWTAIADSEVTNTDGSPALDSTPATSSIKLRPAYAGKKIKVELVQKYTITDTDNNGVWEIAENISGGTAVEGKTKSTVTPDDNTVALGTLDVSDIAVKYTATTVIGQPITNSFVIDIGLAKDANTTSWTYTKENTSVTYVGTGDVAPNASASGDYSIKFSVAGYNDATVTKSAFVNVQAVVPDVSGALVDNPSRIEHGKIAFAITGKNVGYRTTEWEYSTNGGSSWTSVTTSGTSAEITRPSQLHVRTKVIGTKDIAGYVAPSEEVAVPIDNDTNVGTKVVIGSVTVASNGTNGAVEMGDTLTATAVSAIEGQTIKIGADIGTITWVWKAAGTAIHTEANTTSLTSTYQLANVGTCYNKAITVEAQYQYLAAGEASLIAGEKNINKDKSAGTVGQGNLTDNSYTLSYFGGHPSPVGDALAADKLTYVSGNMTNKLGNTVLSSMGGATFTFESGATVPAETGNVNVTAHVNGYKDITFSVRIVAMPEAPSPSQSPSNDNPLISREITKIPYGAILFVDGGDGIRLSEIEYCYAADYVAPTTDLGIDSTPDDKYHDIPDVPLFNTGNTFFGNLCPIYIRYKRTATKEASLPVAITLYNDAQSAGYLNIGTRRTTISISVAAESTIQLSANGTTLTASGMKSGAACTWFVDDVQVEGVTGSSYNLSRTLTGVYAVRVESINDHDEKISATATVSVQ